MAKHNGKKKSYYTQSKKTIKEILRELQEYNRENNTNLTYGQYVLKIEGRKGDV